MSRFKIDWVLLNELAIGPAPTKVNYLNLLQQENIKTILSLCDKKEANLPKEMYELFICKEFFLPDHRSKRIPDKNELLKAMEELSNLITIGPLFVHCLAGVERSPLLCMAWLVKKHKLSPQEAMDYLLQVHKGTCPLPEQLAVLNDIYKELNNS